MTNRWWAPAQAPDSQPIPALRAYAEVLGLFVVFFGAAVLAAAVSLTASDRPRSSGFGWGVYGPAALDSLGQAALAVAVVVLLVRIRGHRPSALGLTFRRGEDGRIASGAELRVAAWAAVALIAGSIVAHLFAGRSYPYGSSSASHLFLDAARSINAGILEETVVLAFVVITLQQARRRSWEIFAVAVVLRMSYHIYYGAGVIGIMVWAALFVWLFLRTRSLLPLIIVHAVWDLVGFLARRWPAIGGLEILGIFALVIVAPITWLSERNRAAQRLVIAPSSPGSWHPDPSGHHLWRWWSGTQWTEFIADT